MDKAESIRTVLFFSLDYPDGKEKQMFKRVMMVLAVAALVIVVGCAKPPEAEIQKANTAIEAARTAEAETYAPAAYRTAMDTLNAANAAKTEADGKFALFRSYSKAKELYVRAEMLANDAVTQAQAEKERVKAEVTQMLVDVKAVIDSAQVAFKKAPRGKGSKADLAMIQTDLDAVATAYAGAEADFNNGAYASAKAKLENTVQKARAIMAEIAAASARKK